MPKNLLSWVIRKMVKKILKIRPYARLLTMLGEQLIKNEQIALTELIKNSYDADADWVKVSFENFGKNFEITENSKIIIEDNGSGMTLDVIEKSWMNPATPNKFRGKGKIIKTKKGRIVQGEKGIGRFAILKLGNKILITTKAEDKNEEYVINYDLSAYDADFLTESKKEKDLYIDDINIEVSIGVPRKIIDEEIEVEHKKYQRGNHGTIIEISGLGVKGSWSRKKIENIYQDILKLQSIFDKLLDNKKSKDEFRVGFYINSERLTLSADYLDKLSGLLENKAVFGITNGIYSNEKDEFTFEENSKPKLLKIDAHFKGLNTFKRHFCIKKIDKVKGKEIFTDEYRKPECGDFSFNFYIFDLNRQAPSKYLLDRDDNKLIKEHRIYLYRDGIRVYPYGNPDDDWLRLDVLRGIERARFHFSNDQVVGVIEISKKDNPELKDKTNREGLIDEGNATQDFIALIQSFLSYYRQVPYAQYVIDYQKNKKEQDVFKTEEIKRQLELLKEKLADNKEAIAAITNLSKTYNLERNYLVKRVETTEDLASIGLSVETASHDMMSMLSNGLLNIDDLTKDIMAAGCNDYTINELYKIRGIFSFVESQMKDIQVMFKSTKQRRRNIRVEDILQKVIRIYKNVLNRAKIKVEVEKTGSPLVAKCTDAILLQLFINLFDNAIYWLGTVNIKNKKILITLKGNEGIMIFSDNGPGVREDDKPYIFEPFYSGKGEDGRGLGLYIARQLLERIDYSIELADRKSDRLLSGANFVVSFVKLEE